MRTEREKLQTTGAGPRMVEPRHRGAEVAKDPICGMVIEKAGALTPERGGRTYYFCSPGCLRTPDRRPGALVEPPAADELHRSDQQEESHAPGEPPATAWAASTPRS
jgi:YHS domain-containing protein